MKGGDERLGKVYGEGTTRTPLDPRWIVLTKLKEVLFSAMRLGSLSFGTSTPHSLLHSPPARTSSMKV